MDLAGAQAVSQRGAATPSGPALKRQGANARAKVRKLPPGHPEEKESQG